MDSFLRQQLDKRRQSNLYRNLQTVEKADAAILVQHGRSFVNFSSNDYLGLAHHPALIEAACEATRQWGAGSGASRLITGNFAIHEALESDIADWKGTEAALLFNSGYHANIGAIPALADAGDLILSDALNHASLIDGARLSRAKTMIFSHNDVNTVDTLLQTHRASYRHCLIITESVFSMDGDLAPLAKLLELAERHDAWLYLDEAHATGVIGPTGAGLAETLSSQSRERLIQMGTLGKALGSFGAYIAGSQVLKEYLVNRARAFIFTTALPPGPVAAARKAIELIRTQPAMRDALWRNILSFHEAARSFLSLQNPSSAIIPLLLGEESATLKASEHLRDRGFIVHAIRPPTVPSSTSRLRLTLSTAHEPDQIAQLVEALQTLR